jgi:peptide/nickel transport system substrate-binding protein
MNRPYIHRPTIVRRRKGLAPLALAAGFLVTLAACSSGSAASPDEELTSLRVVLGYEPMSMDLCDASSAMNGMFMTENIGEPLVDLDFETSQLEPKLAESWEQVDPNTWRFVLRDDVTFHNGDPFDAQAVADWINRVLDPELACWLYGSVLDDNVEGATAVDEHTVDITTASPDTILPRRLAFVMIGVAGDNPGKKTKTPIGTGPYELVEYNPSSEVKVQQFEDYWGDAPEFREVTYPIRVESSVRAAMAATGEVDIATMIAAQDAQAEGAVPFTVAETMYFRIDVDLPPFDDIRVRKALGLAIDRDTFITNVFGGLGKPANAIVVPSTIGYPDDVTSEYDPDEAKSLLDQARRDGVDVDLPFKVVSWAGIRGSNGSEVPDTIVAMLKDVGFNASTQILEIEPMKALIEAANDPKFGPALAMNAHGNVTGDALTSLQGKLSCEAPQSPVCDKHLDGLLKTAAESAGDERRDLLAEAFRYASQELVAIVPIAHMADTMIIANDRIQYTPNPASSERLVISDVTAK